MNKQNTNSSKSGWKKAAVTWGPVVLYMAAIFLFSGQSQVLAPKAMGLSDKAYHALAYLLLALLAYRASASRPLVANLGTYKEAFMVTVLYGATDEIHQRFTPGRSCEFVDWAADVVGAIIGLALIAIVRRYVWNGGKQVGGI